MHPKNSQTDATWGRTSGWRHLKVLAACLVQHVHHYLKLIFRSSGHLGVHWQECLSQHVRRRHGKQLFSIRFSVRDRYDLLLPVLSAADLPFLIWWLSEFTT